MALKTPTASWRKDKGTSSERGYTWAWTKARKAYLAEHPLCVMCGEMTPPRITPANVVDHVIPHQGNSVLFWDEGNWQALCKLHHDTEKAEIEGRHKAKAKFDSSGRVVW
jgi:5-methylcytosine-specific restriction endonuclease McrA